MKKYIYSTLVILTIIAGIRVYNVYDEEKTEFNNLCYRLEQIESKINVISPDYVKNAEMFDITYKYTSPSFNEGYSYEDLVPYVEEYHYNKQLMNRFVKNAAFI